MFYASPIKTLPETLRSPTGLAILASLGIHGLLWKVLPVLPLGSEAVEVPPQQTVGLIQLTPTEQARLPQVARPQVPLPSFAYQSSALPPLPPPPSVLPRLQSIPSSRLIIPAKKTPASKYSQFANLPNVLSPLPPPPPANSSVPSNETLAYNNNPSRASSPQRQTSPVRRLPAPYQNNQSLNRQIDLGQQPNLGSILPPPPPPSTERPKSDLPSLALKPATPFVPPPDLPDSPITGESTNPQNIKQPDNQQVASANTEPTPSASSQPSSTSAETALRNAQLAAFSGWQIRGLQKYPNVKSKPPITEAIKTCQQQLDGGVAAVGVTVDPEGKIVLGPELLDKTGAAGIEQAAKAYVRQYPFPSSNNPINQSFRLNFKYDTGNCAAANREPVRGNTKPTPQTTTTENTKPTPRTPTTENTKPTPRTPTTENTKPTPQTPTTENTKPTPQTPTTDSINPAQP